jgi:hypothetical protein
VPADRSVEAPKFDVKSEALTKALASKMKSELKAVSDRESIEIL